MSKAFVFGILTNSAIIQENFSLSVFVYVEYLWSVVVINSGYSV